jgi:hypothetical protein
LCEKILDDACTRFPTLYFAAFSVKRYKEDPGVGEEIKGKRDGDRNPKKVPGLSQRERISKKFEAISYLRKHYPVNLLCRILGVSASGFCIS